jgi:ADP-heptose:LPS heptosyltransferase
LNHQIDIDERPLNILVLGLCPLGNWLLGTGLFHDIRRFYPRATIYHLTQLSFAQMAKEQGCFDNILTTRWYYPPYDFFTMNLTDILEILFFKHVWRHRLRKTSFDILFDVRGGKFITGLYQGLIPEAKIFSIRGERSYMVSIYQELSEQAGIPFRSQPQLRWLTPFEQAVSDIKITGPFCVLIPKSLFEGSRKNWPLERFVDLSRLLQSHGLTPMIMGNIQHLKPLKALRLMKGNIDMVAKKPLHVLASIFAKASLVVGVDTGTTHMASIVGAPTVALYGPSPVEIWEIYGRRTAWIKKKTMDEISVDEVWKSCQKVL